MANFGEHLDGAPRTGDALPDRDEVRILIVDDDPSAIHILRRALSDYREVRFAINGADSLTIAAEWQPSIILLDADMPGQNGFDVCRKLKANPQLRSIPVIFVSAHDDVEFESKALELGAADFLSKPISPPRVRLRVRLHLQLKLQWDRLRALSMTDGLTHLANRRAVDDKLSLEWARANRSRLPLSLLVIDVDYFKAFNDAYGHQCGDDCLRAVARAVASAARRPSDLAGRIGGEEFAVILADTPESGAIHLANRVREAVEAAGVRHCASATSSIVTVSIGVACHSPASYMPSNSSAMESVRPYIGNLSERELFEAADRALYLAKQNGRNRVETFSLSSVQTDPRYSNIDQATI